MAWPRGVKRSSGSRVTLPTRVTVLSAMSWLLLPGRSRFGLAVAEQAATGGLAVGQADELVADDLVREAQGPVEVVEVAGLGDDLEDDVVALVLVVDLVGEAALAPPVGGGDGAAAGRRSGPPPT